MPSTHWDADAHCQSQSVAPAPALAPAPTPTRTICVMDCINGTAVLPLPQPCFKPYNHVRFAPPMTLGWPENRPSETYGAVDYEMLQVQSHVPDMVPVHLDENYAQFAADGAQRQSDYVVSLPLHVQMQSSRYEASPTAVLGTDGFAYLDTAAHADADAGAGTAIGSDVAVPHCFQLAYNEGRNAAVADYEKYTFHEQFASPTVQEPLHPLHGNYAPVTNTQQQENYPFINQLLPPHPRSQQMIPYRPQTRIPRSLDIAEIDAPSQLLTDNVTIAMQSTEPLAAYADGKAPLTQQRDTYHVTNQDVQQANKCTEPHVTFRVSAPLVVPKSPRHKTKPAYLSKATRKDGIAPASSNR